MCLTKRTNKKINQLTKLKNNKVYPLPQTHTGSQPTTKFDALLEQKETQGKSNSKS